MSLLSLAIGQMRTYANDHVANGVKRELAGNYCGNGFVYTQSEDCDDGNNTNGDGCSSTCTIESGYTCNGNPSVCQKCGNSKIEGTEACDDGNTTSNDGCSSICAVENGWICNGAILSICQKCGNGIIEGTETCDDNNTSNNDGCSSSCAIEAGWTCNGAPSVCQKCGDGVIQGTEVCDDSNTSNDDGCSSLCTIDTGYTCSGTPSVCQKCGNSHREGTETCDDGNIANNDGCSSSCVVESGWTCSAANPSVCQKCGDGIKEGTETCDDNNTLNGDGCNSSCTIESGWTCNGMPSFCHKCGNSHREGSETCDDGNTISGDGCSSSCLIESGYSCTNAVPNVCSIVCGNGVINAGEICDDGNNANNDGCNSTCQVEANWICSGTPSVCHKCGNGAVDPNEACDDGNNISGDGCSSTCTIESGWTCQTLSYSRCNKSSNLNTIKSCLNTETETAATASMYTAVGIVFVMSTISKAISLTSFASLWLLINQIQIIVLLIVSQIYLPKYVVSVILSNKIMINLFHYIPLNLISIYNITFGRFDSTQVNSGLSLIGLDSGSALVNNSNLISVLLVSIPVHLLIFLFIMILNKCSSEEQQGCTIRLIKYLSSKILAMMTFGFYIRTIIESILILALSTFSEIYEFNYDDASKVGSLAASMLIVSVIIVLLVMSGCLLFRQIKDDDSKADKYEEFYHGLRKTKLCRLYTVAWLSRRLLFVLLIVTISPQSPLLALQILSVAQLLYFIYVAIQRPYIEAKDNLIEIINELFFCIYLLWFWYYNSEDKWNSISSNIYVYLIVANNTLVFLIISSKCCNHNSYIVSFCLLICKLCKRRTSLIRSQITPTQNIDQINRIPALRLRPVSYVT